MAIDRVGTAVNTQVLLNTIQSAESALNRSNKQVASGQVSDTYSGYGNRTAALEAARSAAARAEANAQTAQQAVSRLDLQDTQLTQLGQIVDQVREALTLATATNDSTSLMGQMQDLFDQAVTILNAKDGSGYIYGGGNDHVPPVNIDSLDDLTYNPFFGAPPISTYFDNDGVEKTMRVGENRTVKVGVLASDLGGELFSLFRQVVQYHQHSEAFGSQLSSTQQSFLQGAIQNSMDASTDVNAITGSNGDRYQTVKQAITDLQASATVYKGFVGDIQDVDMAQALAKLNQNQVALQAAFQVSATLNQLSLLNFLN